MHADSPVPATDYINIIAYNRRCGTCSLQKLLVVDGDAFPEAASILGATRAPHLLLNKAPSTQANVDTTQSWLRMVIALSIR